jgi:hypothetical protein
MNELTDEQAMDLYESIAPLFYGHTEFGRADTIRTVVRVVHEYLDYVEENK